MIGCMACFTLLAAIAKTLAGHIGALEIAFVRVTIGCLFLTPFIVRYGLAILRPNRPWLSWARALLGVGGMTFGMASVMNMPMANAIAIAFTAPFWTAVLASAFLKEKLTRATVLALFLGFVGMLVVMRPSAEGIHAMALVALLGAICNGAMGAMMPSLTRHETQPVLLAHFNIVMAGLLASPALWTWIPPRWGWDLAALLLIGLLAVVGQWMSLRAYQITPATTLAPVSYVQLPFALFFGYVLFDEVPDLFGFGGMAVIAAALALSLRGEARQYAGS
ncbi:DMT family transporter [Microvirga lotononidis]|uniref:Putative permease, DMT superfamily n=1 Tax=Microvirga lotononidis TaxID=864069 RepID=I4YXH5_9HYPH|nr:DMT family transporter [Microvirga lotononidis]EIM28667.1 putative permease, DMT superfamily [Microvirga lotononidis]WQO29815.1 DMT family transporter [Microvirga lotononidis]